MAILSYVHEIQTVYNVVQNPQMILQSEKGAPGVSSRCEKVGMLLPQRSYGSTLKNHMLFTTDSTNRDPAMFLMHAVYNLSVLMAAPFVSLSGLQC